MVGVLEASKGSTLTFRINWRKIKGQHDLGEQDRGPLTGKSASERVSEREGFQSLSEIFRAF